MTRIFSTPLEGRAGLAIDGRDLVVEHVTITGAVRALTCAYLSVRAGEGMAVMGPSGCGKSTLLGLLAGLAVPTRGSVRIGGRPVSGLSDRERVRFRRRVIGMVYQADNLLPHLTVEENVGLQLAIHGAGRPDRRTGTETTAVLSRLGLGALARRLPDELSGGQRQRVAVARAIVHRPAVLLADEPTGALDPASARSVIELVLELTRQSGATLVVVTHDPGVARYFDRCITLEPATDGDRG